MLTQGELPLESVFEERAEHLSRDELLKWTAAMPHDRVVLEKLMGPGCKLLSGPRGSGKSTMLLRAYYKLIEERKVLPVYINYSRSLALEPLFHSNANALKIFRQWVLMKALSSVTDALSELKTAPDASFERKATLARDYVVSLERGEEPDPGTSLAPSELVLLLEDLCATMNMRRCVLLMDDAAHVFSPLQQREFFEIVRELRTRLVAPKIAVYPGITTYSPFFHIGHEAELVESWANVEDANYLDCMTQIVRLRLPADLSRLLESNVDLVNALAYAAYGIPRGFLNMLALLLGVDEDFRRKPTWKDAKVAVDSNATSVLNIYLTLSDQLPRYRRFVSMASRLEASCLRALADYNKGKTLNKKAVVLGIGEPISPELERMLGFLESAGVLRKSGTPLSKGVKGMYQRFSVHYSILISGNVLALGKSSTPANNVEALSTRDAHSLVKTTAETLLGQGYRDECKLDLAPCKKCGAARLTENARFCVSCGAELTAVSVYVELLKSPIQSLRLTPNKVKALSAVSGLRTVHDLLLDNELTKIRSAKGVGPVWANKIRNAAEEFVSV